MRRRPSLAVRRALAAGAALVAVAAGVLVARWAGGAGDLSFYAPEEYVERADRFIRAGWLVADCSGEQPRLVPRLDEAPAAEAAWYEGSYLAADVARFNAEPESFGWAFVLEEGCRLAGVNPVVHRVELPFARDLAWRGWIFYGGGASDAALRSPRRTITLVRPERPVAARDTETTEVGAGEEVVQEGVVLLHFAGGPSQPAVRVWPVGDEVVVANRVRRESPESARLLGHRLPVGRMARLETGDWLDLEAERPARREETFVFLGGDALEAASVVRRQNERYERRSEDAGLGRVPGPGEEDGLLYLDLVARSVEAALAALPPERGRRLAEGFDLQLTVRRDLQRDLGRRLAAEAERLRAGGLPFAAALTVMDGKSGALLALASWPDEAAVAAAPELGPAARRRLSRNQNLVRHPIGSAGKPFLFAAVAQAHPFLLDLELDPHAGEEERRELFHCELPSGYQVGGAAGADGGRIGFARALEISSNRYTVELATLALAAREGVPRGFAGPLAEAVPPAPGVLWPRPGASSGVWIGGRRLDHAPDLGEYVFAREEAPREPESGAALLCNDLDRLELVPFRAPLERLTGAGSYRGRAPRLPEGATRSELERSYGTARFDLDPWGPLVDHLLPAAAGEAAGGAPPDGGADAAAEVRAAFQAVAPERVDLAFNQITRLRQDFVSLLLGGATSTWTNVQLAESMARLVTGRAVEARLVEAVLPREEGRRTGPRPGGPGEATEAAELAPPLDLSPEVRHEVLAGLARVVEGGSGTARRLDDELAAVRAAYPGDAVWLFSKTGSPTLLRSVPRDTARALVRLVEGRRLRLVDGRVEVVAGGRPVPWARVGGGGRRAWNLALGRALGESGFRGRWDLVAAVRGVVDPVATKLAAGVAPESLAGPLRVGGGGLWLDRDDDLFRRRRVRGRGAVYAFTLVRLPGAGAAAGIPTVEQLAAPEARVISGALHLGVGPGSSRAVEAMERLLPELVPLLGPR